MLYSANVCCCMPMPCSLQNSLLRLCSLQGRLQQWSTLGSLSAPALPAACFRPCGCKERLCCW